MTKALGRHGAVVALALLLAAQAGEAAPSPPEGTVIRAPYQQELYDLGYSVFLANNNPEDARRVAEMALKAHPHDPIWLRRAAQTAQWSGRPEIALKHWAELALNGDAKGYEQALILARQLHDLDIQKRLVGQHVVAGSQELLSSYIALCEQTGTPDDALKILANPRPQWTRDFVLAERLRLYALNGEPQRALAMLDELATLRPLSEAEALQGASLWYGIGHADKAWELLQRVAPTIPSVAINFWQTYSDLGWGLGQWRQAAAASQRLLQAGKARSVDYQRLIEVYRTADPRQSYGTAREAWQFLRQRQFLRDQLTIGSSLKRWGELRRLLDVLTPGEWAEVKDDALFWSLAAQVYRQTGAPLKSLEASWRALNLEPESSSAIAGHLWLLLDMGKTDQALRFAETVRDKASQSPDLSDALGAVYARIGDSRHALRDYRLSSVGHRNDPDWLLSYADLLDQVGRPEGARLPRLMALQALRLTATPRTTAGQRQHRLLWARLRLQLLPGGDVDRLFRQIANGPLDDETRDLVLAWLLADDRQDMARLWLIRAYPPGVHKPDWAQLNLALQANDLSALEALLAGSLSGLPYREAIEAAQRVGQLPLAETVAFEKFQLNDGDAALDQQVRDLDQQHLAWIRYGVAASDRSGIGLLEQGLGSALPLTNRVALHLDLKDALISPQKGGQLGAYPSTTTKALLGLTYRYDHGEGTVSGGFMDGLYRYATAQLEATWRFASWMTADLSLGTGLEANESVPLLLGGMKDEVALGATWSLTGRDSLNLRGALFTFRDQDWRYLGEGASLDAELDHRLTVAWPDVTLKLFGGVHAHRANGTPQERTWLLIPSDSPKVASFFIPDSFGQIGSGVALGQGWKDTYSRQWRPFADANVIWNSVSGAGFSYELGLAGPLLGLDTLSFSLSQERGGFGNNDLTTSIIMRYLYRF